jgi:hypothetical protein
MNVEFKYRGQSAIVSTLHESRAAFATNTLREATFFRGTLRDPLLVREGLAALHAVVVSDLRYHPKDRLAFRAWLEEQDRRFLAGLGASSEATRKQMKVIAARLDELDKIKQARLRPFHDARRRYFEYVFHNQSELMFILDPVITIHPDELAMEAFSRDESSYARLAVKYDRFASIDAFECGTTNIDFTDRLHRDLDRMRTYRATRFEVQPSGFTVGSGDGAVHKEKKVDLPESWVKGFLQVHSTMAMGLHRFTLAPIDLFNICRFLARHHAKTSPRALRYELEPGRRVRVVFEPWEHVIELSPTAIYEGPKPLSVRTWGRDRLRVLQRLLPVVEKVDVYVAGQLGLPSVYVADLGDLTFTLALSGWTENDWSGGAKFDLLTRRLAVSAAELTSVYESLRATRYATDVSIAQATGLGVEKARSAASHLCQIGRAMYDLGGGVFRHRELFAVPFTAADAAAAVKPAETETDPEAKAARTIFQRGDVRVIARRPVSTGFKLSGSAKGVDGGRVRPLVSVDHAGQILEGTCTCAFFKKHQMTRGPCQHLLALRLAHMARLSEEDKGGN